MPELKIYKGRVFLKRLDHIPDLESAKSYVGEIEPRGGIVVKAGANNFKVFTPIKIPNMRMPKIKMPHRAPAPKMSKNVRRINTKGGIIVTRRRGHF